jgi:pimeloyl-ACP methyl ester carboxylesterase
LPAENPSTKSVSVNGVELPYIEEGVGEPVLFVHGSNADYRVWDDHRKSIASRYRIIALSQRYFGKSPWPDIGENFCMQVHADDLAVFVQSLEIEPATIVGWSTGAGACLTMAVQNPHLVRRMFLYEPALATFVADPVDAKAALDDRMSMSARAKPLADAGDLEGAVRMFMDGVNAEVGAFDRLSSNIQKLMIDNARMLPLLFAGPQPPDVMDIDLRNLNIPITIALGKQSRDFYRIAAFAAQTLLPMADFKIVENARHLLPVQNPRKFSQLVLDFLDRNKPV